MEILKNNRGLVLVEKHPQNELQMLHRVGRKAVEAVLGGLATHTKGRLSISADDPVVKARLNTMEGQFDEKSRLSHYLAEKTYREGQRPNLKRHCENNEPMKQSLNQIKALAHKGTPLWVVDGVLVSQQGGGLKRVADANNDIYGDDVIHDLSVSAATGRFGFDSPYILLALD